MRRIIVCGFVVVLLALAATVYAQVERWDDEVGGVVYSTALSGDGAVQLAGTRNDLAIAYDSTGQELWRFQAESTVWGVATSADGQWSAVVSEDRHLYLLDAEGNEVWRFRGPRIFADVAISRDGTQIIASDENRKLYYFNRDSNEPLWEHTLRNMADSVALYGGDTVRAVVGTRDSQVILFSSEGQRLWGAQLAEQVASVDVNRNGTQVVAASLDGQISLINGANAEIVWQTRIPVNCNTRNRADCLHVSISGDGENILAAGRNGRWYLLDGEDGSTIQEHNFPGTPTALTISGDGQWLMFGNDAGSITATTIGAAESAFATAQRNRRNLLIAIPSLLLVATAATSVWVQRTQSGKYFWNVTSRPARKLLVNMWRSRVSYMMLLPTLVLLLIFNYYPALSGLYHSFTDWNPGIETTWVGLEQFENMFSSQFFWVGLQNALILAVAAFVKLVFPLLVAEFIFHIRSNVLQYYMRTLFIVPLVLPSVVGVLLWVNIYDPNIGLLNNTLTSLGLDNLTRAWLGNRDTAMASIVAIGAPWVNPLALLIFYGGLIGIPQELFDAAKVDGASWWARFIKIDLPLLMGQIRLLVVLAFIGSLQEFQLIFLTTGGGPGSSTYTPALELYYQATRFNNFGLASAMGTFLFLLIMVGTIINLRTIRSQTEYEA